jgi:hypothetical protein
MTRMKGKQLVIPADYGRFLITLAATALLLLAGCREEEELTIPAGSRTSNEATAAAGDWLEIGDGRTPLAFLAEGTGLPESELSPGLDALAAHYRESPRMIANRVLQLWERPPGAVPAPPELMHDLLPRHGQGKGKDSLGSVMQHYRVLREQGLDHTDAIAAAVGKNRE